MAVDDDGFGDADCDCLDGGIHLKCRWAWAIGWGIRGEY